MNIDDYNNLISKKKYFLKAMDNKAETLLFGKTGEYYHHVYQYNGSVYFVQYDENKHFVSFEKSEKFLVEKRIIPEQVFSERSNYSICNYIRNKANIDINILKPNLKNIDGTDFNEYDVFIKTGLKIHGLTNIQQIDSKIEFYNENHISSKKTTINFNYNSFDKNQFKNVTNSKDNLCVFLNNRMDSYFDNISSVLKGESIRDNLGKIFKIVSIERDSDVDFSEKKDSIYVAMIIVVESIEKCKDIGGSLYCDQNILSCLKNLLSFKVVDNNKFEIGFSENGMQGLNYLSFDFSLLSNILYQDLFDFIKNKKKEENILKI